MLTLTTPINFAQPLSPAQNASVLCLSQSTFTNDLTDPAILALASAQISLVAGNVVNDQLQQVGGSITLSLGEAQCAAIVAAQATLLSTVEQIVMQAVEQQYGVTGTIT